MKLGKVIVAPRLIEFFEIFTPLNIRAMALFPFIVFKKEEYIDEVIVNHERIHFAQQLELLIIPFYIWYIIEGAIKGYRNISFEREAYSNQSNLEYLKTRKFFNFYKYITK